MPALYIDGCDVSFDPATADNVRANLGALGGRTHLLRPGDVRALGPGEVLDGRGCLALPRLVDAGRVRPSPDALCPMLADLAAREGTEAALLAATLVAARHRRGARVLAGTPAGAGSLIEELEWLVRGGLTPGQAIAAATVNVGARIAEDAPADWILVPGGPLADLRALRRPRHVIVGGVRIGGE